MLQSRSSLSLCNTAPKRKLSIPFISLALRPATQFFIFAILCHHKMFFCWLERKYIEFNGIILLCLSWTQLSGCFRPPPEAMVISCLPFGAVHLLSHKKGFLSIKSWNFISPDPHYLDFVLFPRPPFLALSHALLPLQWFWGVFERKNIGLWGEIIFLKVF